MNSEDVDSSAISARRQAFDAAFLSAINWAAGVLVRHWLFALNVLTGLLTGLAFVAPFLLSLGLWLPAQGLYLFYSTMCHQLPQRAYFVFGYQVAQCQRNTAIYGAFFAAGIAYAFLRHRLGPLDWRIYALLILPMAIDGGTQLVGWRESNWELRTVTGALFGGTTVWLLYPRFERQVRALREGPRQRVRRVVLYTKPDCTLCDKAKQILDRLQSDYPLAIEEVDITGDAALRQEYQYLIPVIRVDGRVAAAGKVSEVWLRRHLDALD